MLAVYSCCYTLVSYWVFLSADYNCFYLYFDGLALLFFLINSCIEYKLKDTLRSHKHQIPRTFSVISVVLVGSLANVMTHTSESRRTFFSVAPHLGYALPYSEFQVISPKKGLGVRTMTSFMTANS